MDTPHLVEIPRAIAIPPRRLLTGLRWLVVAAASLLVLRDGVIGDVQQSALILGMVLGQETFGFWLAGRDLSPGWIWTILIGDLLGIGAATIFCPNATGNFLLLYPLLLVEMTLIATSTIAYLATFGVGLTYIVAILVGALVQHHSWTRLDWVLLFLEVSMFFIVTGISMNVLAMWRARVAHISRLALLDELSLLLADTRQLDDVLESFVELVPAAMGAQACVIAIDEPSMGRRIWANLGADTDAMIDESLLRHPATDAPPAPLLYQTQAAYDAVWMVPLEIDERAVGLLSIARVTGEPFESDDQRLFLSLARHAAQALRNAHLYRLEAEAARSSRQLEQFKSEMLAGVSHEFRLPLASISLAAETLLSQHHEAGDEDIEVRLLRNILRSTHRLGGFVQDLLDLTRLEAHQLQLRSRPYDIVALTREVVAHFEPICEMKQQHLCFESSLNGCILQGDRQRIEQILSNLLTNAHQYTPEDGTIRLTLSHTANSHVNGPRGPVQLEDAILIGVHDSGPGIPLEERGQIFDRFSRGEAGRRRSAGVGLGLYIARSVVDLHGGCLWVGDNSEGGSSFWCLLPLTTEAETDESDLAIAHSGERDAG